MYKDLVANNDTFSLNTPRGLTVFQKKSVHMSYVKYINNEL